LISQPWQILSLAHGPWLHPCGFQCGFQGGGEDADCEMGSVSLGMDDVDAGRCSQWRGVWTRSARGRPWAAERQLSNQRQDRHWYVDVALAGRDGAQHCRLYARVAAQPGCHLFLAREAPRGLHSAASDEVSGWPAGERRLSNILRFTGGAVCRYRFWAEHTNSQGGILINGARYKVELKVNSRSCDPTSFVFARCMILPCMVWISLVRWYPTPFGFLNRPPQCSFGQMRARRA
jgi:hypothetical protein